MRMMSSMRNELHENFTPRRFRIRPFTPVICRRPFFKPPSLRPKPPFPKLTRGLRSTPTLIYVTTSIPSTPKVSSQNPSAREKSKSATIGIAVGATAAATFLIIVITIGAFCLYQRRRRRKSQSQQRESQTSRQFEQSSQTVLPISDGEVSISPAQELSGFQAFEMSITPQKDLPVELSTDLRAELPTDRRRR